MIGKIGLHVTANLVLPGLGSALVVGGQVAADLIDIAKTIKALSDIKKSGGDYDDNDKRKAGYYATKFVLLLAK